MKQTTLRMLLGTLAALTFGATSVFAAATVAVGSCTSSTSYATIQQAVNASAAGTTIDICPGTYAEQIVINKSLTLIGVGYGSNQKASLIVPPAGGVKSNATDFDNNNSPVAAQILVQNTAGPVVLNSITVDGSSNGLSGCGTDLVGILFQNASGIVENVVARNQALTAADQGCQVGEAILVQTQSPSTSTVTVQGSSVHDYQKNGVTGDDLGTTITISSNDVRGWGPTPVIAQNGIQVCCGATGTINFNKVVDDVYTGPTYGGAGILLYDSLPNSGITANYNQIGNTQIPVGLYTDGIAANQYGDGITVTGNRIYGAIDFDGVDICTNNNIVSSNIVMNSRNSAFHLDAGCTIGAHTTGNNNMVINNTVNESDCAAILADPGTTGNNASVASNTLYNVAYKLLTSTSSCSGFAAAQASTLHAEGHPTYSPKPRAQERPSISAN